jgi:hypothetical protein
MPLVTSCYVFCRRTVKWECTAVWPRLKVIVRPLFIAGAGELGATAVHYRNAHRYCSLCRR